VGVGTPGVYHILVQDGKILSSGGFGIASVKLASVLQALQLAVSLS
jgi:hypothetical protein